MPLSYGDNAPIQGSKDPRICTQCAFKEAKAAPHSSIRDFRDGLAPHLKVESKYLNKETPTEHSGLWVQIHGGGPILQFRGMLRRDATREA
jgi:hypothetical protein